MTETAGRPQPINDLYSRAILRHTAALGRLGQLEAPDGQGDAVSRLCGSRIAVDIALEDAVVRDFAQTVEACALGQCAASIVAQNVVGQDAPTLRGLRETMAAMLKANGPPPEGAFADLAILETVRDYPARHGSVMLVFDALVQALDTAQGKTDEPGHGRADEM